MRFGKIFVILLAVFACAFCLLSCSDEEEGASEDVYYNVTFNSAGGSAVEGARVISGSKLAVPEEPVKEGFIFNGWRHDAVLWDFDINKVTSDVTLTAGWIDATSVFDYDLVGEEGNKTAVLKSYTGSIKCLRIPTHIAGYPVTGIGERTFEGLSTSNTYEIIVGENITSVGGYAFSGCVDVKITVEGTPAILGERAFYACNRLETITLGGGMKNIPTEAFLRCEGLVSVVLPNTVESVSENAFDGCSALKTITVHSSLKTVADSAFVGCDSLKAIYYYGTAAQWAETQIAEGNNGNDALGSAAFYMYSETEPAADAEGKYWYFKENGSIRIW